MGKATLGLSISIWNHCNHPASSGFIYLFNLFIYLSMYLDDDDDDDDDHDLQVSMIQCKL